MKVFEALLIGGFLLAAQGAAGEISRDDCLACHGIEGFASPTEPDITSAFRSCTACFTH